MHFAALFCVLWKLISVKAKSNSLFGNQETATEQAADIQDLHAVSVSLLPRQTSTDCCILWPCRGRVFQMIPTTGSSGASCVYLVLDFRL